MRITIFGATGVLGRTLLPVLLDRGHEVAGTTRKPERLMQLAGTGAVGRLCDAFSPASVDHVLAETRPDVVVHLMTDLPRDWGTLRRGTRATDAVRRTATRNLVDAASRFGVRRIVAQSIAFMYQPGPDPATEDEPLWVHGPPTLRATFAAARELEQAVVSAQDVDGIVLRYGTLYGPGTWYAPDGDISQRMKHRRLPVIGSGHGHVSFVHVHDAATATAAAISGDTPQGGVLNVVDDRPVAHRDFLPAWAEEMGWPQPLHIPAWAALPLAGRAGVAVMTVQRGASNSAIVRHLKWRPEFPSWRDGLHVS